MQPTAPPTDRPYDLAAIARMVADIPGWCTSADVADLTGVAFSLPGPAAWAEVGAWCGKSAAAAGLALPPGSHLHVVDPLGRPFPGHEGWGDFADLHHTDPESRLLRTLDDLRRWRPDLAVTRHPLTGRLAAPLFAAGSLDVVYVDARHLYDDVVEDCETWMPKLKPYGLLLGHDYGSFQHPDVAPAVHDLYGDRVEARPGRGIFCVENTPGLTSRPVTRRRPADGVAPVPPTTR